MDQIRLDPANWPKALDDAKAKIRRAEEHIRALRTDVHAYLRRQPFELVSRFELEPGCHVVRLKVREEPPPRLSTIVGDIAHNLRSALDCVSWRLAIAHVGLETAMEPKNRRRIVFPITETPAQFERNQVLPFFSDEARAVFERVQPYQRRFTNTADAPLSVDPLILIRDLSNIDKHVAPPPAFVSLRGATTLPGVRRSRRADLPRVDVDDSHLKEGGRIEDGAVISRVRFPLDIPPEDTDLKLGQPTAKLTFGNGADPDNLEATANMITAVVQDFSEVTADLNPPPW